MDDDACQAGAGGSSALEQAAACSACGAVEGAGAAALLPSVAAGLLPQASADASAVAQHIGVQQMGVAAVAVAAADCGYDGRAVPAMRLDTAAGAAANLNPDPSLSVYSFQHAAAAAALQRSAFHHPFAASLPLSLHHCALAAVHKQALLQLAAGAQQLLVVHNSALALIPGVLQELCALWPLFEEQLLDQRPLPVSDKEMHNRDAWSANC